MKTTNTLLLFLLLISFSAFSQLPVSQTASNKNVVLEEFTGIYCVYCPDGHRIANEIQAANPDDVVLINIHTGGYASPNAGDPDFRTNFGSALANQSGLTGYPSGTVNRHVFTGTNTALGRNNFNAASNIILGQSSYVNVALEGTINAQTRELVVNVEVYYTGNSPVSSNYINVVLLQDKVEGPQTGASTFYPEQILPNGNYQHMHMLRHMITGQWGDIVNSTSQGTLIQRQYVYTIPDNIRGVPVALGDLSVAAFLAESQQEIITGSYGPIQINNLVYTNNVSINSVDYIESICSPSQFQPSVKVENSGQTISSIEFSYDMNGTTGTYIWNGTINSLTSETIILPSFDFPILATNTFNLDVVSINGNADENTADSSFTASNIIETNNSGVGTDYVIVINQDRYGSETSWELLDETLNIIANGGPYSDLTSNGTLEHRINVTLQEDSCYQLVVKDSYGDGMCCAYGSGGFSIETATGDVVFQGSGSFVSENLESFYTISDVTAVSEDVLNSVNLFPNPNKGVLTIQTSNIYKFNITDVLGREVFKATDILDNININISNLKNGVYFVNFSNQDIKFSKKIILSK